MDWFIPILKNYLYIEMTNHQPIKRNHDIEWICIKIPIMYVWLQMISNSLSRTNSVIVNKGFCLIFPCDILITPTFKFLLIGTSLIISGLYIIERKMIRTTLALSIFSFIVFSIRESSGVQDRNGIIVFVFFVQFLAYFFYKDNPNRFNLRKARIFYSIQVIVACYTLSAISKLSVSGFSWFLHPENFVLQLYKTAQVSIYDSGDFSLIDNYLKKIDIVSNYQPILSIILFAALMTELTSGFALLNKKTRAIWGLALLGMHLGIYLMMDIIIDAFYYSVIFFMLNPFYQIYRIGNYLKIRAIRKTKITKLT